MNAFNRLIMLIIALLLLTVPVLILLVGFGVLASDAVSTYTQNAASAIGGFTLSGLPNTARIIAGVVFALVALVALILILREIAANRSPAKAQTLNEEAGKETRISAKAVRSLTSGAAREAGADSPNVSLASSERGYKVGCKITASSAGNYTELAERCRDRIQQTLENQSVPVRTVEVTVESIQGSGS